MCATLLAHSSDRSGAFFSCCLAHSSGVGITTFSLSTVFFLRPVVVVSPPLLARWRGPPPNRLLCRTQIRTYEGLGWDERHVRLAGLPHLEGNKRRFRLCRGAARLFQAVCLAAGHR